ncbi:hypothetical protein FOA32_000839 [Streptococcus sinensis]|nr:hypothetical protein [Streptococcus sinensis]
MHLKNDVDRMVWLVNFYDSVKELLQPLYRNDRVTDFGFRLLAKYTVDIFLS